jgi:hypothetical protein
MTAEPAHAPTPPPAPCPACGAPAQGKFCSACGASLAEAPANAYLLFVDSFFKLGEFRRYAGMYGRILRSPTRATLELFDTCNLSDALRFLEYSVGILVLLFLSRVLVVPGDLLSGFLTNVYFVLAQSVGLLLHYRLALFWVEGRTFAAFMRLAAIFYGFTLPISDQRPFPGGQPQPPYRRQHPLHPLHPAAADLRRARVEALLGPAGLGRLSALVLQLARRRAGGVGLPLRGRPVVWRRHSGFVTAQSE